LLVYLWHRIIPGTRWLVIGLGLNINWIRVPFA
jgi:hypothetical protein